jgi:hypothetical protein
MRKSTQAFELSASDLVAHLNCRHLSALNRAVAEGALREPYVSSPLLEILWERGLIHERNYLEHLAEAGSEVVRIEGIAVTAEAIADTVAAMKRAQR